MEKVLLKIKPSSIIVGTDFKFGSDRKNWQLLKRDFNVETVQYNSAISTTKISKLLTDKKIEQANDGSVSGITDMSVHCDSYSSTICNISIQKN